MEFAAIIIVCALTFGVCWLCDKGFNKIFRSKVQHASGLSVKLNKRYATIGLVLVFLGICAVFAGLRQMPVLAVGGVVVALIGVGLVVYYLSFGIYYDDRSFILSNFGKRSVTYRYDQIVGQMLYNAGGNLVIELHMKDGKAVSIQATMVGAFPFLDHAFQRWCHQTGRDQQSCDHYDPDNCCWFPNVEGK